MFGMFGMFGMLCMFVMFGLFGLFGIFCMSGMFSMFYLFGLEDCRRTQGNLAVRSLCNCGLSWSNPPTAGICVGAALQNYCF